MHILSRSQAATRAVAASGELRLQAALGRTGSRVRKREGDGATPIGIWHPLRVYYRADRTRRPRTGLPVSAIRSSDGWCDAPADRNYNRCVRLPYAASAETMWRTDRLYDIVVVLDHNASPRKRHGGSAIFIHLARPGYAPTEGCVALRERDLRLLLARLHRRTPIAVHTLSRPLT